MHELLPLEISTSLPPIWRSFLLRNFQIDHRFCGFLHRFLSVKSCLTTSNMLFETVAKAVELKRLIDYAPRYLPKIGRCPSLEKEFRANYILGDDEEPEEDETPQINVIQRLLELLHGDTEGYSMNSRGFEDFQITVLGTKYNMDEIKREDVEKWYAEAGNSAFGNVALQETQHDTKVRSSRELDTTHFEVGQDLLKAIGNTWETSLVPTSVSVKLYKLVIYGPGDHFQYHKDTPEEKLCGTFLMSLFKDCEPPEAFELNQNGKSVQWEESDYRDGKGWCAFYPDIPHRVKTLQSGYRAILSFKTFAETSKSLSEEQSSTSRSLVDELVTKVAEFKEPLGLILNHHYGYDSKSIYGCDKLLIDSLEAKGMLVDLKPILIRLDGVGSMEVEMNGGFELEWEEGTIETDVFSLTEESLDIVRKNVTDKNPAGVLGCDEHGVPLKRRKMNDESSILFVHGGCNCENGLWKSDVQAAAMFTGNESNPFSEHSVYVRYAAIVRPPS